MKRKNVFLVIAFVVIIALALAGCSGKKDTRGGNTNTTTTSQTQSGNNAGGTSLGELNDNNWQTVIKANFGIDFAIPTGWTFKETYSPNKVNNLKLSFTSGDGTTVEAEGRRLFEATRAISPHGNYKNNVNWENETVSAGDVVNDLSEVDSFNDSDVNASWSFTFNSKQIMVNYYGSDKARQAEYTFTINNR